MTLVIDTEFLKTMHGAVGCNDNQNILPVKLISEFGQGMRVASGFTAAF